MTHLPFLGKNGASRPGTKIRTTLRRIALIGDPAKPEEMPWLSPSPGVDFHWQSLVQPALRSECGEHRPSGRLLSDAQPGHRPRMFTPHQETREKLGKDYFAPWYKVTEPIGSISSAIGDSSAFLHFPSSAFGECRVQRLLNPVQFYNLM